MKYLMCQKCNLAVDVGGCLQESLETVSMGAEPINQHLWMPPSKISLFLSLPLNITKSWRLWRNCGFSGGSAPAEPNPHLVPAPSADNYHHFHHIGSTAYTSLPHFEHVAMIKNREGGDLSGQLVTLASQVNCQWLGMFLNRKEYKNLIIVVDDLGTW